MQKILIPLLALIAVTLSAPPSDFNVKDAETCTADKCAAPDCRCSSTTPPAGVDLAEIPQFVMLTFDDDIQALNYDVYIDLFYNKTNPDGCQITSTYFISHEYTDYTKVHDLYLHNQEIALHSISHAALTDYWREISIDNLTLEFGGEKTLIAHFANIPEEAMKGMRLPFLQLSGDNSFQVAKDIGLTYDCSWPTSTFTNPGLWPYTLDYKSTQDCPIGPCPTDSIPGFWEVPMIDWTDQANIVCSMVDACVNIPDNLDDLLQWFIDNFNRQYNGNRAPFGFFVHAAYFDVNPIHLEAYRRFVDYLLGLEDVYLVSPSQVIDWIKNPVPVGGSGWPACPEVEDLGCEATTCPLLKGDEMHYLVICGQCPEEYPWLGNPLGEAQDG